MKYQFTSLAELPPFLTADHITSILGISRAGTYILLHSKGFPTITIGKRYIVEKEKFLKWIEENTAK